MKRWIAFLLSVVMVLSLMPMAVMAEEAQEQEHLPMNTLYVGTVNALETPQGDGWSYDASTSTLTLNNCTLTESMLHVETYQDEEGNVYYDRRNSMIYFDGDLTIELIGTNSVERVVENAPGDYTSYYAICGSLDIPDGWDMPAALKFTGTGNLTVGLAVTADYLSEDGYSMNDAWEYFEFSSGIGVWGGVDLSGLYGGGWMDIYGGVYGVQAHYIACAFANYPTFGDNCIVTAYQDVEGTIENENGYNWNNNDAWRMKVVTGNAILKDNGQLILMDKDSASGEGWTWENQVLTLSEGNEVKAVDFRSRVESAKLVLTGNVTLDATDMGYDANWNAIAAVTAFCDLDINAGDYTLTLNNGWDDALRGELCDVTVSGGTVVAANEGSYAVNMIGGDLTVQNAAFRSANGIYSTEGYDADYNTVPAGDVVLSGAVVVLDSPITSYGALTILNSDVTVTWGYEALYSSTALTVRDSNLSINASGYALASNGNVTVDNCSLDLIAEESVIYRGYYHYEWNDESDIPDASCFQLLNMDITQPEGCTVSVSEEVEEYYTKYTVQVVDGNGNAATTMKATAAGNEHEHSYENGVCSCGAKQTFTITWKDEDGTILEVDTVEYGDHPEYNGPTPTKTGVGYDYTFRGWSNGTQYTNVENVIVTQDWTYTAGYTSVAHKHYLIFMDSDGVTEISRYEVYYGKSISGITTSWLTATAGTPKKDCYTLTGWERPEGLGSSYTVPDYDPVYVAIWDGPNHTWEGEDTRTCSRCGVTEGGALPEHTHIYLEGVCSCGKKLTFTITWKNWDGTVLETDTVEYGVKPEYNGPTPTKEVTGQTCTFAGWGTVNKATADKTYTATFYQSANKYNVILMDGDTELGRHELAYDAIVSESSLPEYAGNPTKPCCTIAGWQYADGTRFSSTRMTAEDMVLYIVWDGPNHTWVEATCDAPKTCTSCGLTEGEALGHSYTEGVCTTCGAKQTFTVTWYNWDGTVLEVDTVEYGETPEYNGPTPTRTGVGYEYTFYAWGYSETGSQIGTPGPATYHQHWHAKFTSVAHKHYLIFMDSDGVTELGRFEKSYNQRIVITTANLFTWAGKPTKDCYTLSGWYRADGLSNSSFSMPDHDVVFVAIWDGPNHTWEGEDTRTCSRCGVTEGGALPEHTHIYLEGVCACGKIQTFTITWVNWDGTVLEVDTVEYGTVPTYDGPTPTRPNVGYDYTFNGWTVSNVYQQTIEAAVRDRTYTASYLGAAHKHDIVFMDGETELARKELYYSKYVYTSAATLNGYAGYPTKDCYTLSGWAYADGTLVTSDFYMPDEDVVMCAVWDGPNHTWVEATCEAPKTCSVCGETEGEALDHTYTEGVCSGCGAIQTFTVTWVNWDGTVLETDTVEYGTVPTYDGETPTRPNVGYDFKFYGWALSASGAEVTPGAATKDVTYYAKYTSTVHKHNLIFLDDDGVTELGRYETYYSKGISGSWLTTAAGNPTKEGYTLTGWTYADGSAVESYFYMPDNDVIFVAVWEPTQYTLHFDANEGSFEPYSAVPQKDSIYTIGDTVTLPKAYRTGYTLTGYKFYTDSACSVEYTGSTGTMPAQELWAVAQWEINFYGITFYPEGGIFADGTTGFKYGKYEYNTPFMDQLPEISRDCYTFQGWKLYTTAAKDFAYTGSTEAMPARELHAVAQWSGPNHMDVSTDADHSCDTCGAENVTEHSYEAVVIAPTCTDAGYTTYTCNCGDSYVADEVAALGHSYDAVVTAPTCTEGGYTTYTCANCGDSYVADEVAALGHSYDAVVTAPTCTEGGYTTYTCANCGDTYTADEVPALGHDRTTEIQYPNCTENGSITVTCGTCGEKLIGALAATGHSYENGSCTACGQADPNAVTRPTLTLKAPALEFKDMIKVVAFFTAENTEDVVEMGMITYTEKVDVIDISTAAHVIPGAEYEAGSGRYFASSQGIHGKYLGDTVYLACYAKLTDGSYVYTKLAGYGPLTYATNQLKSSTNVALKQLCAAMLNYGAAAQNYFAHNTDVLANATLTDEQKALPEAFRDDMVTAVPAADAAKQGEFANNQGFSSRRPAVSFEGAFSINYFFTPKYAPVGEITLYYWTGADFAGADVLTAENASGSIVMDGEGMGQYRGDVVGIAAKDLSEAVYVAAVYSDGTTTWTSGVLGYSIGAYCSSMAKGTDAMADLAMATAVYGYHAKQYFGS